MFWPMLVIVIMTTIWVGYDAEKNKITTDNKPYSANNGAVPWVIFCLLLWIIAFPCYLYKRSHITKEKQDELEEKVGLCKECGKYYAGSSSFCPNCGKKI